MIGLPRSIALILIGILVVPSNARLRKRWSPEELLAMADVIVLGKVESVSAVKRKEGEAAGVFGDRFSLSYYEASIKVTVVIKGEKVAKTIKLRFSQAVSNRVLIDDPPIDIALWPNQLCLFYLKESDEGVYLNVLHEEMDQDKAVVHIKTAAVEQAAAGQSATAE